MVLGLRSLRTISRNLGASERQLAADAARFAVHIPWHTVDGKRRYGTQGEAALRLVTRLRAAGRDDAVIAAELARGPVAWAPPTPPMSVTVADLATAINRRRERRQRMLAMMREALRGLTVAAERHRARVAEVQSQGGDLASLRYYDDLMARFRAELRSAERMMAQVYRAAADSAVSGGAG
jgi:hypothetical protein